MMYNVVLEEYACTRVVENKIGELDIKGVFRITNEAIVGGEVVDGRCMRVFLCVLSVIMMLFLRRK